MKNAAPFTCDRQGRSVQLSFWTLPADGFDGIDTFLPSAEIAVAAARRAKRAPSTTGTKRKTRVPKEGRRRRPAP